MKTSKSCFWVLFITMLLLGTQGSLCVASTKAEGADAQAYLKKAMAVMSRMNGYRVEMAVDAILPTVNANITSGRDFFMRPVVGSRISSEMLYYDSSRISDAICVRSYAKQSGEELTDYMYIDNQWTKRTVPYRRTDPYDDGRIFLTDIKKAKIRELHAENVLIDVTVDGKTGGKKIAHVLAKGLPSTQTQDLEFLFDFKSDITYIVGIDRHTGYLTRVDMNLSDAIKKNLSDILERHDSEGAQMDAKAKKKIQSAINDLQVTVQMMVSQFDRTEPFEIPAKAIKQAVDEKTRGTDASAIGIIGGADGPTSIYISGTLP